MNTENDNILQYAYEIDIKLKTISSAITKICTILSSKSDSISSSNYYMTNSNNVHAVTIGSFDNSPKHFSKDMLSRSYFASLPPSPRILNHKRSQSLKIIKNKKNSNLIKDINNPPKSKLSKIFYNLNDNSTPISIGECSHDDITLNFKNNINEILIHNDLKKMVTLIVGGERFDTTLATLSKENNNILSDILKLPPNHYYELFIDRYVLNYLRNGFINLYNLGDKLDYIYSEAQYYNLEGLSLIIESYKCRLEDANNSSPSQDTEYKIYTYVPEVELLSLFEKKTINDGFHFDSWMVSQTIPNGATEEMYYHIIFYKILSKGEVKLFEKLKLT